MTGLSEVEQRITEACARAGRSRDRVQLVAVSKGQPVGAVQAVYQQGQRVFGESRAQELSGKYDLIGPDAVWHFIGPLQRNKVRQVRPAVSLLHSLDRIELAHAWMKGPGQAPPVLLQIKLGAEESKHGFEPGEAERALAVCESLGVRVRGLMAIPPPATAPDEARGWFGTLRELRDQLDRPDLVELSMGMSQDFEVAIEEGATIIRVGSAIFGARTT